MRVAPEAAEEERCRELNATWPVDESEADNHNRPPEAKPHPFRAYSLQREPGQLECPHIPRGTALRKGLGLITKPWFAEECADCADFPVTDGWNQARIVTEG